MRYQGLVAFAGFVFAMTAVKVTVAVEADLRRPAHVSQF